MCVWARARTGTCVCSMVHLCGRAWLGQRSGVQGAKGERAPSRGSALAVSTGSRSCSSCRAYSSRHLCRSACPRGQRRMPHRQARVGGYHHRHPGDRSAQQCTAHHHSTMYGRTRSPSQPGARARAVARARGAVLVRIACGGIDCGRAQAERFGRVGPCRELARRHCGTKRLALLNVAITEPAVGISPELSAASTCRIAYSRQGHAAR